MVISLIQQHLQTIVLHHPVLFPHIDSLHDDIVNLLRRRRFPDHRGAWKPGEENRRGRSPPVDLVVQFSETGDDEWVVGYFGARKGADGGLEDDLCTCCVLCVMCYVEAVIDGGGNE